jgi:hypothetical protein
MLRFPRRTLLKAVGAATLGLGAASRMRASQAQPGPVGNGAPAQPAPDPIDTLASDLDYDLERIYRFVADEIGYEPYEGVLRGPRGTLRSRAGNSADKALLLASLLQASLFDTRFVFGALDDATVDALLASATIDVATARERALAALDDAPAASDAPPTPGPSPLPPDLDVAAGQGTTLIEAADAWAGAALDTGVRTIVGALDAAGIGTTAGQLQLPLLERNQHVWVQVAVGPGWVDYDPSVPGAVSGTAVAAPVGEPVSTIPDELWHRVQFSVIAERLASGALEQELLIDHVAPAASLTDLPIALAHEKPDGLAAVGIAIGNLLGGGIRYQAILQLGTDAIVGTSAVQLGSDGTDVFGDGAVTTQDGDATAEWLETRVLTPDGRVSVARRVIFDRVGTQARASGTVDAASIPPVELVSLTGSSPDEFLPLRTLYFVSVATGASGLSGLLGVDPDLQELASYWVGSQLYHLGRDAASWKLELDRGVRSFVDAPNLAAYTMGGALQADGTWVATSTTDLLHRSLGTLPIAGMTPSAPAGILAGVLGHVVERVQAGEAAVGPLDAWSPGAEVVSVGAIFDAAASQGIGIEAFTGSVPGGFGEAPEAAERLGQRLADGWIAIAPVRPVTIGGEARVGWWLVDPVTGRTLDELDDGRGATLIERAAKQVWIALRAARPYLCLGLTLYDIYHFIHELIDLNPTGALVGGMIGQYIHKKACH